MVCCTSDDETALAAAPMGSGACCRGFVRGGCVDGGRDALRLGCAPFDVVESVGVEVECVDCCGSLGCEVLCDRVDRGVVSGRMPIGVGRGVLVRRDGVRVCEVVCGGCCCTGRCCGCG